MVCVRSAQESITLKCDRPFRGRPRLVQWNTYSTIEAGDFKMIKFANSTHFQARPQNGQFPFRTFVYGILRTYYHCWGPHEGPLFSPHGSSSPCPGFGPEGSDCPENLPGSLETRWRHYRLRNSAWRKIWRLFVLSWNFPMVFQPREYFSFVGTHFDARSLKARIRRAPRSLYLCWIVLFHFCPLLLSK